MVIKNNILVTGSNGQLGKSLQLISKKNPNFNFFFCSKNNLNITNYEAVENYIKSYKITTIINCAAYTNVKSAENNFRFANLINCIAVRYLCELCHKYRIKLIHISTDYVFDGKKKLPYNENDKTNPVNNYGLTKLNGEKEILNSNLEKSIIIRTSWLYSKYENNFVRKIIDNLELNKPFSVISDEVGSPTNSFDLAETILILLTKIDNKIPEIYHYSNSGYCSRFQFATHIKKILKSKTKIKSQIKKHQIRPDFTVLDNEKIISKFGLEKIDWKFSLQKMLDEY